MGRGGKGKEEKREGWHRRRVRKGEGEGWGVTGEGWGKDREGDKGNIWERG